MNARALLWMVDGCITFVGTDPTGPAMVSDVCICTFYGILPAEKSMGTLVIPASKEIINGECTCFPRIARVYR